jgi:hypothetical protein
MHQLTKNQLTAVFGFIKANRQFFDLKTLADALRFPESSSLEFYLTQHQHVNKPFDNWGMLMTGIVEHLPNVHHALVEFGKRVGVIRPNEQEVPLVTLKAEASIDQYDFDANPHIASITKHQLVKEIGTEANKNNLIKFETNRKGNRVIMSATLTLAAFKVPA